MTTLKQAVNRMLQHAVSIGATQIVTLKDVKAHHLPDALIHSPSFASNRITFCDLTEIPSENLPCTLQKISALLAPGSSIIFQPHVENKLELELWLSELSLLIYEHVPEPPLCLAVKRPS